MVESLLLCTILFITKYVIPFLKQSWKNYVIKWELKKQIKLLSPLQNDLYTFYEEKVKINENDLGYAKEILESVMLALKQCINERSAKQLTQNGFIVGDFILSGSVCEGLKVIIPNEFDVIVPLILPPISEWGKQQSPDGNGFLNHFIVTDNQRYRHRGWVDLTVV